MRNINTAVIFMFLILFIQFLPKLISVSGISLALYSLGVGFGKKSQGFNMRFGLIPKQANES